MDLPFSHRGCISCLVQYVGKANGAMGLELQSFVSFCVEYEICLAQALPVKVGERSLTQLGWALVFSFMFFLGLAGMAHVIPCKILQLAGMVIGSCVWAGMVMVTCTWLFVGHK